MDAKLIPLDEQEFYRDTLHAVMAEGIGDACSARATAWLGQPSRRESVYCHRVSGHDGIHASFNSVPAQGKTPGRASGTYGQRLSLPNYYWVRGS